MPSLTPVHSGQAEGQRWQCIEEADSKYTAVFWRPWEYPVMMQVTHDAGKPYEVEVEQWWAISSNWGVRSTDRPHHGCLLVDSVPGLTKPEPGISTAKRTFWYLGLYNNFFQSWLWAGKEDMLSEADPPANYQFLFISSNKTIIQRKKQENIFCVNRDLYVF